MEPRVKDTARRLRYAIAAQLANGPALIEQVSALLQVPPITVAGALRRMACRGVVARNEVGAYALVTADATAPVSSKNVHAEYRRKVSALPMPHELDGDWRFTDSAVFDLANLMAFALRPKVNVCCVGTPSIALLLDIARSDLNIDFVDYNEFTVRAVQMESRSVACYVKNLLDDRETVDRYDVIFMDPPWDGEYCEIFARWALRAMKIGGYAAVVYYPPYLRPHSDARQVQLVTEIANGHGRIVAVLPERVVIQSHRTADGTSSRRGDGSATNTNGTLAIIERVRPFHGVADVGWDLPITSQWQRFYVDGSTWMLRSHSGEPVCAPYLRPVAVGRQVSRFDTEASSADLWTAGDQLFAVRGREVVAELIGAMSAGADYEGAVRMVGKKWPNDVAGWARDLRQAWSVLTEAAQLERQAAHGKAGRSS